MYDPVPFLFYHTEVVKVHSTPTSANSKSSGGDVASTTPPPANAVTVYNYRCVFICLYASLFHREKTSQSLIRGVSIYLFIYFLVHRLEIWDLVSGLLHFSVQGHALLCLTQVCLRLWPLKPKGVTDYSCPWSSVEGCLEPRRVVMESLLCA